MKQHDHEQLEHDDTSLPPFVTRTTMPASNDQRRREFDSLYAVFAAREMPQYGRAAA